MFYCITSFSCFCCPKEQNNDNNTNLGDISNPANYNLHYLNFRGDFSENFGLGPIIYNPVLVNTISTGNEPIQQLRQVDPQPIRLTPPTNPSAVIISNPGPLNQFSNRSINNINI